MIFKETPLQGAYLLEPEIAGDERGFFARTFCVGEFDAHGLEFAIVQCNVSFNRLAGTLRGMHFQVPPRAEAKLVRCTRGSIYDVIVDLRGESPTYRKWFGVELTAGNLMTLFVPEGFAHGFQTLEDDSEVFYHMSEYHSAEHARGVRWNDPAFGIRWPIRPSVISERDASFADFAEEGCSETGMPGRE